MYVCMHVCMYVCVYVCMYVCMYIHIYINVYVCMYMFITSVFAYVYLGFIFECIYLGSVYKRACMSIHILFWLYCIWRTYRKRKKKLKKRTLLIICDSWKCVEFSVSFFTNSLNMSIKFTFIVSIYS